MKTNQRIAAASIVIAVALLSEAAIAGVKNATMDAFYDDKLFTINFMELPSTGEASTLLHNKSINTIYMCEACASTLIFVSVLDAIQGDGFNPLWQEVQIVSTPVTRRIRFTSDNDILAAAQAGEITLIPTNEVYRCSVLDPKK